MGGDMLRKGGVRGYVWQIKWVLVIFKTLKKPIMGGHVLRLEDFNQIKAIK